MAEGRGKRKKQAKTRSQDEGKLGQTLLELLEDFKARYDLLEYDSDSPAVDPVSNLSKKPIDLERYREFKKSMVAHCNDLTRTRDKKWRQNTKAQEKEVARIQSKYEKLNEEVEESVVARLKETFAKEAGRIIAKKQK